MKCTTEEKNNKRKQFEELKRKGIYRLKGICSICGSTKATCFHHIVPLSMVRGTNEASNVIEVCYECHSDIHGSLALITGPITEEQKVVIAKANTKMLKIKYDFTSIDSEFYGDCEDKGFEGLINSINEILTTIMDKGYKIRWSKTGKSPLATIGARKTINSQLEDYNDEYRICRRKYDYGYINIYIPYKKGVA